MPWPHLSIERFSCSRKMNKDWNETSELKSSSLFSLAYGSSAVRNLSDPELRLLVSRANVFNSSVGITGYLCVFPGAYFQYLEGDEFQVEKLMALIHKDERHQIKNVVHFPRCSERIFPHWHMRLIYGPQSVEIQLEHILRSMLLGLHQRALLDPSIQYNVLQVIRKIASAHAAPRV